MYIAYLAFEILFSAELFCDVQPLVQSALDGYNVSIFAFGQTHSGKTHTMVSISFFCCLCACVRKSLPLSNKTQKEKGIGTCKRVLNSMLSNNWKWNGCLWVNYFYIFCLKSMMIGLINLLFWCLFIIPRKDQAMIGVYMLVVLRSCLI